MRFLILFLLVLLTFKDGLMAQGYVWSRGLFGSVNNYAFSVAHDAAGNVFVAGHFGGTIDLDPGAGVVNVTSFG
ncbi:MAG: hypothetical protein IPP46_11785 [Bacteroidetes bacterium]|nr:hypothetical protein [Bacteroidota bacterium]